MDLERFLEVWQVDTGIPPGEPPELVVAVAHGATATDLTNGSKQIVQAVKGLFEIRSYRKSSSLAFCSFAGSPTLGLEAKLKQEAFGPDALYCGDVMSTTEECKAIKAKLRPDFKPNHILFYTDQAHSRRADLVWKTFFPDSKIWIATVLAVNCVDLESPMASYHTLSKMVFNQAWPICAQWPAAKLFGQWGLTKLERFHQPIA